MGLFDFLKKDKKEEAALNVDMPIVTEDANELELTEEFDANITYASSSSENDEEVEIGSGLEILDETKFTEELKFGEHFEIDTENAEEVQTEIISEETTEEVVDDTVVPEEVTEDAVVSEEVVDNTVVSEEVTDDTVVPEEVIEVIPEETKKEGLFAKMKKGLLKTKDNFTTSIDNVFKAFSSIDDDFYDELEETLILADLGARTSMEIIETLKDKVYELKIKDTNEVKQVLIDIISDILNKDNEPLEIKSPTVILVIGVNGAGKTTSIGKLANLYKNEGKSVLLAAGDTFRAAAIEQLEEWGKRSDIPVIKHAENADSSAVIYDAIKSSEAKNIDVLICDTAGRLHNKKNLMAELEKINRVIAKEYSNANLETFLVLDGTAGQNALEQAKQFNEVCNITGLVLTKLDGTAKGGIIISIKNEMHIPVRYIGVGESIEDLQNFDSELFAKALFETE